MSAVLHSIQIVIMLIIHTVCRTIIIYCYHVLIYYATLITGPCFIAGPVRGTGVVKFQQDAVQLDPRKLSKLVIVPEQQCESGEQCVAGQRSVGYPDG